MTQERMRQQERKKQSYILIRSKDTKKTQQESEREIQKIMGETGHSSETREQYQFVVVVVVVVHCIPLEKWAI